MKKGLLKIAVFTVFLAAIFQAISCSSPQQTDSEKLTALNESENSTPVNKQKSIDEENFSKEWRSKFDNTAAELERNRRLWQENQIIDYDFVVTKNAPGLTSKWRRLPIKIKIREREKTSIELDSKKDEEIIYSRIDGFEDFDTIDKLFNYLRQELEDGKMLEVKYHKKFGYPKSAVIIDSIETHGIRSIEISKLEIIK